MLSLDLRIDRAERLLQMLEEDAPFLAQRVADLTPEHQESARNYAAQLAAHARAELKRLRLQQSYWNSNDPTPEPAD